MLSASAPRNIPTISSNLSSRIFQSTAVIFHLAHLQGGLLHDIVTQHLIEGSVARCALKMQLHFELKDIPTNTGVLSHRL